MKTKEFIKFLENELGYAADMGAHYITIKKEAGKCEKYFATVGIYGVLDIDTSFYSFGNLDKHERDLLFNLILDYARTPLEEREEEKKYRYELPVLNINDRFLHLHKYSRNELRIDHSRKGFDLTDASYHFTDKEVEQYTGKDRALFNACEKIEVSK